VRSWPSARRGVACVTLLAVAAVLFSGCSSTKVPPSGTAAPTASQPVARLDRLEVRRTDAFPQNHLRFSFPVRVVVNDASQVRRVAAALFALPTLPPGVYDGPADLGVTYHLWFFAGARLALNVTVDATGMQTVERVGAKRTADQAFWTTLAVAMGLPDPGGVAFGGTFPGS